MPKIAAVLALCAATLTYERETFRFIAWRKASLMRVW